MPRDLQNVLARFFRGHAELALGGPALYARDCCPWSEAVVNRFAVEPNVNLDMTTAVEMCLKAGRADVLAHNQSFVERLVGILKEEKHVALKAMLLDEERLQGAETMVRAKLNMFDFAETLALIKDVDRCHVRSPLGIGVAWHECHFLSLYHLDRNALGKPERGLAEPAFL